MMHYEWVHVGTYGNEKPKEPYKEKFLYIATSVALSFMIRHCMKNISVINN